MHKRKLEICCFSLASALNAQKANAHSIELCQSRPEGGVTPSFGLIKMVRANANAELHVMIRPRGGDFIYSAQEMALMKSDINVCKQLGVDGVVFGMLSSDGTIDIQKTIALTEFARPLKVTFHRAFDMCCNPIDALQDLINIGIDRVLTSGGVQTAIEGQQLIQQLVVNANGRITIVAGSGLNECNIKEFAEFTGVNWLHCSALAVKKGNMQFRNTKVRMGGCDSILEYDYEIADVEKIRKIIQLING